MQDTNLVLRFRRRLPTLRYIGKKIYVKRASRDFNELLGIGLKERDLDLDAPPLVDFTEFIDTDADQLFYEHLPNLHTVFHDSGEPDIMAPRFGLNHLEEHLRCNMNWPTIGIVEDTEDPKCIATAKVLTDDQDVEVGAVIGDQGTGKQIEKPHWLDGAHSRQLFDDKPLSVADSFDADLSKEFGVGDTLQSTTSGKLHLQLRYSHPKKEIKRVKLLSAGERNKRQRI